MKYTNELLVGICEKLQLQPSMYELAKKDMVLYRI